MRDEERAPGEVSAGTSSFPVSGRPSRGMAFVGLTTAGLAFGLGCAGPAGGEGPEAPAALGAKNHAADVDQDESGDTTSTSGCGDPAARTFAQAKGPAAALDGACLPEVSRAQMNDAFRRLRDTRLGQGAAPDSSSTLIDERGEARRLPWLLADNSCEERAPAAAYLLSAWGFPTPYYARAHAKPRKSLHLDSPNLDWLVTWSGHVAPVYRSEGTSYILDPAVEPARPITVEEWLTRITYGGTTDDLEAAFCRDEPAGDGCTDESPRGTFFPQSDLRGRLGEEWRLQQVLGRLPEEVLGNCPPWAACFSGAPPAARRTQRPVLKTVISYDHTLSWATPSLVIVGENFGDFSTVRFVGDAFEGTPVVAGIRPRALRIDDEIPVGMYDVTVFNDDLASTTLKVKIGTPWE